MTRQHCEFCDHWKPHGQDTLSEFGLCHGIRHQNEFLRHSAEDEELDQALQKAGVPLLADQLAVVDDPDGDMASLFTRADFGCVLFVGRSTD